LLRSEYGNYFIFDALATNGSESYSTLGHLLPTYDSNINSLRDLMRNTSYDIILADMGPFDTVDHGYPAYGIYI
jgi:hypothetical protein